MLHIRSPGLYFQRFEFRTGMAVFREMTPESFRRSSFLDDRIVSPTSRRHELAVEPLLAAENPPPLPPARMIFHTAYCCSTLLSRALDLAGRTIVYREPAHLHQLAVVRRRPGEFPVSVASRWAELLRFSLSMLAKTWCESDAAIVKPTDSCNNIIADILALNKDSRAILLYSQAEEFLASNLKTAGRRQFLRNFIARSTRDNAQYGSTELRAVDVSRLSDAEAAAYVWMTQIQSYDRALSERGDQCVCVDMASLLADAGRVLAGCNHFLGLGLEEGDIASIIDSGIWRKHAKDTGRSYTSEDRRSEMAALSKDLDAEIRSGLSWIDKFDGWNPRARFGQDIRKIYPG